MSDGDLGMGIFFGIMIGMIIAAFILGAITFRMSVTQGELTTKACVEQYGENYEGFVIIDGSIRCEHTGKEKYDGTDIDISIGWD